MEKQECTVKCFFYNGKVRMGVTSAFVYSFLRQQRQHFVGLEKDTVQCVRCGEENVHIRTESIGVFYELRRSTGLKCICFSGKKRTFEYLLCSHCDAKNLIKWNNITLLIKPELLRQIKRLQQDTSKNRK